MTIIKQKFEEKFGTVYQASKQLNKPYMTIKGWCEKDPVKMTYKRVDRIAKALNIDADELRKEIINN